MMPPPTTIVMKRPDALAVYLPRPSVARLKMPPHMTEVHRPQSRRKRHFMGTSPLVMLRNLISGSLKVTDSGRRIAMSTRMMATDDTVSI